MYKSHHRKSPLLTMSSSKLPFRAGRSPRSALYAFIIAAFTWCSGRSSGVCVPRRAASGMVLNAAPASEIGAHILDSFVDFIQRKLAALLCIPRFPELFSSVLVCLALSSVGQHSVRCCALDTAVAHSNTPIQRD